MNKVIIAALLLPFLACCTSMQTIVCAQKLSDPLSGVFTVRIGSIEVTNRYGTTEDCRRAEVFLENIAAGYGNLPAGKAEADLTIKLQLSEKKHTAEYSSFYTVTAVLTAFDGQSLEPVYRGILIKESTVPMESDCRMFGIIRESYNVFSRQASGLTERK